MCTVVRQCYGWSLPYGVSINGEEDFNEKGEIVNSLLVKRLDTLARDLVVYGKLIRGQFLQDISTEVSDTFAHVIDCNRDEIRIFKTYHNEWYNVFM